MNCFPTQGGMSEPVQLSLLGILENPFPEELHGDTQSTQIVKVTCSWPRVRQDFQVWWTHSTGNKTSGAAWQRNCQDLQLPPCSRSSPSSCAALAMWWGKLSPQGLPSPAAHTPLPGVCHIKTSSTEPFKNNWTKWRAYSRLEKPSGHKLNPCAAKVVQCQANGFCAHHSTWLIARYMWNFVNADKGSKGSKESGRERKGENGITGLGWKGLLKIT